MHHALYFQSKFRISLKLTLSAFNLLRVFQSRPVMFEKTVISLLFSIISLNASTAQNKNNNTSTIPDAWQKIFMTYYHDFPCRIRCQHEGVTGCIRVRNRTDKWTLRCQEHVYLLRPKKMVAVWQKIEKKAGYVPLNIPEFSLDNIHAWIVAVHQEHKNYFSDNYAGHINGIFKRHVMTVNKYAFKNMKTGSVSSMNITPTHRFYVKNKNSFIPVSQLTPADILINSKGEQIKLVCVNKNEKHRLFSEESVNAEKLPVQVYNLEVHGKSRYFVGREKVLVHNICILAQKLQDKLPDLVVTKGFFRWKRAYLRLNSFDDVKRTWMVLKRFSPEPVECEACSMLAACEYTGQKLKISLLESFLRYKVSFRSGESTPEEYICCLSYLLSQFGEKEKIIKGTRYNTLQQMIGENYDGAALAAGGQHVGFIGGWGPQGYYYVREHPNRLSKERLYDTVLAQENWGMQNGVWNIDFFVPLLSPS